MKIVINISEHDYREVNDGRASVSMMRKAIRNGKPLPKGHGRLIDIGKYEKEYFDVAIQYDDGNHIHSDYTNTIPTIIEADKWE